MKLGDRESSVGLKTLPEVEHRLALKKCEAFDAGQTSCDSPKPAPNLSTRRATFAETLALYEE